MLLVSKGIHGNQVIQRFLVVQTLLYWNQLKPLAQNCPKNYYLHSSTGVLCSNLAIISILLWFDGKIAHLTVKTWSHFWRLFHTVLKSFTVNQFDEKNLQWGKISEITTLCTVHSVEKREIHSSHNFFSVKLIYSISKVL